MFRDANIIVVNTFSHSVAGRRP